MSSFKKQILKVDEWVKEHILKGDGWLWEIGGECWWLVLRNSCSNRYWTLCQKLVIKYKTAEIHEMNEIASLE